MVISTQWKTALGGSSVCYVLITTKYSTSCNLREDGFVWAQFCVTEGLAASRDPLCVLGVSWSLLSSAD